MSDLAERLVQAAEDAILTADQNFAPAADAAVVAALRLLAAEGDSVEFALNPDGYIRELADEVEGLGS